MKRDPEIRLHEITKPDRELWTQGISFAGIDEAGRGPLAGPVAAACVVMPAKPLLLYVDDSKKLSEKRREILFDEIMKTAIYAKVALVSSEEIDRINILQATKKAMAEAAREAPCSLFLVDALDSLDIRGEVRGIIHGDALCYSIAAASILAKVTRDRLMQKLDTQWPEYGFSRNKGYGTKEHIEALKHFGPSPLHRKSFIGHFVNV